MCLILWPVPGAITRKKFSHSKEIKPVNSKEINPDYLLEGLMLKLKFYYIGDLMRRADSLLKTLMLQKIEGRRRRGWQRRRWLDGIIDSMDMSLSRLQEMVNDREAWWATVHGVTKSLKLLATELTDWLIALLKYITVFADTLKSYIK